MRTVQSADGTTIALDRSGHGPALILVYGAFCDRSSSQSLAEALGSFHRVRVRPPRSWRHSSGAALALEAAARDVPIRKLVVYEPAERFLVNSGAPGELVSMIKSGPYWSHMQAIAHTLPYDITLSNTGSGSADLLANISVPTLALAGGASPAWALFSSPFRRRHLPAPGWPRFGFRKRNRPDDRTHHLLRGLREGLDTSLVHGEPAGRSRAVHQNELVLEKPL